MTQDDIIALAKPYQWNGGGVEGWTFNTQEELIAFATALLAKSQEREKVLREALEKIGNMSPDEGSHQYVALSALAQTEVEE